MVEIDLCITTWSLLKRNTKTNGQIKLKAKANILFRRPWDKTKLDQ